MQRRELLRLLGGTAAAAILAPLAPEDRLRMGAALHARGPAPDGTLPPGQSTLVRDLAETILPRTDTPGALDAGVPEFIERIVAWWDTADERDRFIRGLAAIQARLAAGPRAEVLAALDAAASREPGSAEEAWARLKSMTVYGYFTSKLVQEDVLHTVIIPGRFDGCVPMGG